MKLLKVLKKIYLKRYSLYSGCDELPLKNFLLIISTGDLKYLYKRKKYKGFRVHKTIELSMIWGDIVIEYADIDKNHQITESFNDQKIIYQLENSFIVIKAMIRLLMFITPNSKNENHAALAVKTIKDLRKLGYNINTSNSLEYAKSISNANKRSNSIISRIRIKKSEMRIESSSNDNPISFDQAISALNAALKFVVPDDITVARYCEYKKVLMKKAKNVA